MEEIEVKLVRLCPNHGPVTDYDADFKCRLCGQYTKEEVIAGELALAPAMEREERLGRRRMCRECGKVYWHGAHWKNIRDRLERMS